MSDGKNLIYLSNMFNVMLNFEECSNLSGTHSKSFLKEANHPISFPKGSNNVQRRQNWSIKKINRFSKKD